MSDSLEAAAVAIATAEAAAETTPIALWPADVLARHLVSADAMTRLHALAMALQTDAPVSECGEQLIEAAKLNEGDSHALMLTAVALGAVKPARATPALRECIATLTHRRHEAHVRTFAAQALWRQKCMPAAAAPEVAMMLVLDDEEARKLALFAIAPYARPFAGAIAAAVASVTPDKWTTEALAALAKSAKEDAAARRTIDAYLTRSLTGQPLVPTGIAGYVALAELNDGGAGLTALGTIVKRATDDAHLKAALLALGQLGELARPVARDVVERLVKTDTFEQEELLCRVLVQIKTHSGDIPLARVVDRIGSAPDRNVVPHCMLLTLYPKEFAHLAVIVRRRFEIAEEPLKAALALTHKILTKIELNGGAAAAGSK
jgi:hypothetical protein